METTQRTAKEMIQFAEELARIIERVMDAAYGMKVTAEPTMLQKTNADVAAVMVSKVEDKKISPTLYIEEAYRSYLEGESIEKIGEKLSFHAYDAFKYQPELPEFTPEEAKKHITLTLVNTGRNGELLSETPHFQVGDVSAIPRWQINEEASFIVKNNMLQKLQLTPDEVLAMGQENINKQQFVVKTMREMLVGMMGDDPVLIDGIVPNPDEPTMLVVTSETTTFGSNAILSDAVLKSIHERLNGDYVILPSSLHEVLCLPIDDNVSPDGLRSLVREVNDTQVDLRDFLSDNIMAYNGQKLFMVQDSFQIEGPEPKIQTQELSLKM